MRLRLRVRAFTLVELLVVIGIIAVLIGILVPVLSSVQGRGRDLKCQSNIRQILIAMRGYAAEHKGSLPWGFVYMKEDPVTFRDAGTGDETGRFHCWASLVGKYMGKGVVGDNQNNNFPPGLQCPEAAAVHTHIVGYVVNMVALPARMHERRALAAPAPVISPARLNDLFPWNILIWDTAVFNGLEKSVGYLLGADLDTSIQFPQRFWSPDVPQWRYFTQSDPYAKFLPGTYGNNRPVQFPGPNTPWPWRNIDPMDTDGKGPGIPYQGNLRFRHLRNTAAMCGFADGHVEAIKGKFTREGYMDGLRHDALRKHFMIKWPTGIAPNLQYTY